MLHHVAWSMRVTLSNASKSWLTARCQWRYVPFETLSSKVQETTAARCASTVSVAQYGHKLVNSWNLQVEKHHHLLGS